jgi:hypothetical protein
MSVSSFMSDKDISSFDESVLFSTSPYVFNDFELVVSQIDNENNISKLQFQLVLKDIIIVGLQKQLSKNNLGYKVYNSLISGEPHFIS